MGSLGTGAEDRRAGRLSRSVVSLHGLVVRSFNVFFDGLTRWHFCSIVFARFYATFTYSFSSTALGTSGLPSQFPPRRSSSSSFC